jgi:hypothetical protein
MIISGHSASFEEYYINLTGIHGEEEQRITDLLRNFEASTGKPMNAGIDMDTGKPLLLFSEADIFVNGKIFFSGSVSVDPDHIGAWGLGRLIPQMQSFNP